MTASQLDITPLTTDRLGDLAILFGQGGDAKWCWCAWYRQRSVDFRDATAESNRAVLEAATAAVAAEGRAPGFVAYLAGEPVGWVSYAREHGATLLEAYPADPGEGRIPAAHAFKGTVGMFERAGFEVAARRRANRASPERLIVRRRIRPAR